LPGLIAWVLAQSGKLDLSAVTTTDITGKAVVNSKGIYTLMITQLLPTGLVGILVAALLSGLMSQVAGALNSIATMVSYDVYKRYRPAASDGQLIRAGKIAAGIALLFSLALLPLLNRYESIFNGVNEIITHIAPPITCVFLLGICWKRASATSAKYTLWIGSVLGAVVFTVNKLYPDTWLAHIPFLLMAFYLFCACLLIQVTFSLLYPAVHTAESSKLVWKSFREPLQGIAWKGLGNYKVLSGLLLLVMAVLYWVFK
jgi:SSS family solute:Na+ symporter